MASSDETTAQRQERLLAAEDGRQYAIDKAGTGLAAIATTDRVRTAIASFNLPSAPALFLGLAHKAFATYRDIEISTLFDRHPQGMWPDDHKPLLDLCEQFAAHVVFAFTAPESFAHEVFRTGSPATSRTPRR